MARWRERDPIDLLTHQLTAEDELSAEARDAMAAEVTAEVDRAVAAAEAAPLEPAEDLERFVYTETEA